MTAAVAGFALFALLVTMTPGPDTLLVLRNCVRGGRRTGAATAVGAAVGSLAWGVAAAAGLAAALQRWDAAFSIVRLAGAAYLVLLGVQALWEHRRAAAAPAGADPSGAAGEAARAPEDAAADRLAPLHAFRQGLLSCLLNPKVGIFFVAVAPQFLPEGHSVFGVTLLLGVVDAVIAVLWLLLVVFFAGGLLRRLRRPRVHRNLERATGGVLVALGVVTAAETAAG